MCCWPRDSLPRSCRGLHIFAREDTKAHHPSFSLFTPLSFSLQLLSSPLPLSISSFSLRLLSSPLSLLLVFRIFLFSSNTSQRHTLKSLNLGRQNGSKGFGFNKGGGTSFCIPRMKKLNAVLTNDCLSAGCELQRYCQHQKNSGSGKRFQELISESLLILLRDSPHQDLILVSSKFLVFALLAG